MELKGEKIFILFQTVFQVLIAIIMCGSDTLLAKINSIEQEILLPITV